MIKQFFLAEEDEELLTKLKVVISEEEEKANFPGFDICNLNTDYEPGKPENESRGEDDVSDRSHNLAPFNSTQSGPEDDDEDEMNEDDLPGWIDPAYNLYRSEAIFTWKHKTLKANLQYEREHNNNVDNGVWNKLDVGKQTKLA